jgi:uncharacterized metal-binding protein YceD (DUF177 family)
MVEKKRKPATRAQGGKAEQHRAEQHKAEQHKAEQHRGEKPWRVPVVQTEVPESGLHIDLTADEKVRARIVKHADLAALPRLEASFDVTRHGRNGLRVVGRVSATVGQTCVVTLEPMQNEIDELVDVLFVPTSAQPRHGRREVEVLLDDAPEPLVDGKIDLGALTTEFLILGIDPYPRKPGTAFEAPITAGSSARPFAALATLKKRRRGGH